jgi:hypothetical protein
MTAAPMARYSYVPAAQATSGSIHRTNPTSTGYWTGYRTGRLRHSVGQRFPSKNPFTNCMHSAASTPSITSTR